MVVVPAPGVRFREVATPPSVSANAMIAPPCMMPGTVHSSSRTSSSARTRSGATSTKRMPSVSAKRPFRRSCMAAAALFVPAMLSSGDIAGVLVDVRDSDRGDDVRERTGDAAGGTDGLAEERLVRLLECRDRGRAVLREFVDEVGNAHVGALLDLAGVVVVDAAAGRARSGFGRGLFPL